MHSGEVDVLVAVELVGFFRKGFFCTRLCVGSAMAVCDGLVVGVVAGWSLMWFRGVGRGWKGWENELRLCCCDLEILICIGPNLSCPFDEVSC